MEQGTSLMLRKLSLALGIATVTALGGASAASAAVTFDPATGNGFVGKGDVQYTYNWNNARLQANAASVDFQYQSMQDYEVTCEFDTLQGRVTERRTVHHVTTKELNTSVSRDIGTVTRKNPQGDVNGFSLTGIESSSERGEPVPAIGDECKFGAGNSFNDAITAVELVRDAGGLLVKYGSTAYTPLLSPAA